MQRLKCLFVLLTVYLALFSGNVLAGNEPYVKAMFGPFTLPKLLDNADPLFLNNGTWSNYQFRNVTDEVVLRVNDKVRISSNFTYKINVTVDCFRDPTHATPDSSFTRDLSVTYNINQGVTYKGIAICTFNNFFRVKVTVNSAGVINAGDAAPPANAVVLSSTINVDRIYPFSLTAQTKLTAAALVASDRTLPLSWDVISGAEEYDLEWTVLSAGDVNAQIVQDMLSGTAGAASQADLLFRNNATRITTEGHDHAISLIFNDDYLVARVRGVQYTKAGIRQTGAWSYQLGTNGYAAWNIAANWHASNLNWQYSAAYAEEGKKKEVVNYFDGTLRDRQTVTINTSDKVPVVAEKVYDLFGRPVASILPAPVADGTSPSLHYFPNLNKNPDEGVYNYLDIADPSAIACEVAPRILNSSSGSSRYFSSSSDFKTVKPFQAYTPDAQGYPLAVTQYTPDNTGRVRLQGGVGQAFQPGSGIPSRTTKYLYGKPEQWELDQLFGNDVGFAEHYTKNTVIDPNYQISVSYLNASGKTIATALTGSAPVGMDSLTSKTPQRWQTSTLLKPDQFRFDGGSLKLTASTTYTATVTGKDTVRFNLPQLVYTFSQSGQLCGKCYYDVTVKVTDPCNPLLPLANQQFQVGSKSNAATGCTPDPAYTNTIPLVFSTIGEYNISFEFALNRQDVEAYTDTLFNRGQRAGLINSQWSFIGPKLQALDFGSMFDDCKTARGQLGTYAAFYSMYGTKVMAMGIDTVKLSTSDKSQYQGIVQQTYNNILTHINSLNCDVSPCDEKRIDMMKDVSPGGQFALFDADGVALEPELNVIATNWRTVFPVIANPDTTSSGCGLTLSAVGLPPTPCPNIVTLENGSKISVNDANFTLKMLVKYWKDGWAGLFLPYHPESCKLTFCELNVVSEKWDRKVADIDKAADISTIQSGLSYNYSNGSWLLDSDPFFKSGGLGNNYKLVMQNDLNTYSRSVLQRNAATQKSLVQFVDFNLYQKDGQWDFAAPVSCRVPDRDWNKYRDLYLELKRKYVNKYRDSTSCAGKCQVGPSKLAASPDADVRTSDFGIMQTTDADTLAAQAGGACPNIAGTPFTVYKKGGKADFRTYVWVIFSGPTGQILMPRVTVDPGQYKGYICIPKWAQLSTVRILEARSADEKPSIFPYVNQTDIIPPAPPAQQLNDGQSTSSSLMLSGSDFENFSSIVGGGMPAEIDIRTKKGILFCHDADMDASIRFIIYENGQPMVYYKQFKVDKVTGQAILRTNFVNSSSKYINPRECVIGGVAPKCAMVIPALNGCSLSLLSKQSRFDPENQPGTFPSDTLTAYKQAAQNINNVIQANCEANGERWMAALAPGLANKSQGKIDSLRDALVVFCAANGDKNHIYGSSTKHPQDGIGYQNLGDIIKKIALNDTPFTPTLNPWLLEGADTYDNPVTGAVRTTIYNSSQDIANKLLAEEAGTSSTGTAAKFAYLQSKYGSAMTLTQAELGVLESASFSCNWVLPQGITLPFFLLPGNGGCKDWNTYSSDKATMFSRIPGLTSTSPNYDLILTNYMNQRYGFSLSYADYLAFEASHTGLLCNQPVSSDAPVNVYADIQSKIEAVTADALSQYAAYVIDQKNLIRNGYVSTCSAAQPLVTNKAQATIYHFTLYYYDQADNLVRTVPPEGVQLLTDAQVAQVQQIRNGADASVCGTPYTGPTANSDVNTAFTNLATALNSGQNTAIELWLYNTTTGGNQLAKTTPDGKFLFQVNISNNTLGIDIYSNPSSGQFNNSNRVTVNLSGLPALQAWTHVVVQSTDLLKGKLSVYVNGYKAPVINNALPATYPDKLTTLKHLRIYNHLLYPAEILNNAGNDCFMPLNGDGYWARFNVPAAGTETTLNANSSLETKVLGIYPDHKLATNYQYNATNQVVQQNSPDGGTNRFWYDQLSRLVVSQNDKQLPGNDYSYTNYDVLGRIIEVGQKKNASAGLPSPGYVTDLTAFNNSTANVQITRTFYDSKKSLTGIANLQTGLNQGNLRKRVVATTYRETQTAPVLNATYYDYDLDGNVETLYQQINGLGVKTIAYEYDLISGKVNFVRYQPGQKDQYFYKYNYDAENRITDALSSPLASLRPVGKSDLLNETKITDAHYEYYLHGPLARLELGSDNGRVQGIDYAYTLQGWLKGINNQDLNATGTNSDIGGDGVIGNTNVTVAKDALGFSLGYYSGDYAPIGTTTTAAFNAPYVPSTGEYTGQNLYNGNISSSTVAIRQSAFGNGAMTGYTYHYDQLNRLKTTRQHPGISGSWNKSSISQLFGETYTYDGNGNILTLNRHGSGATATTIDSLSYNYTRDANGRLTNNKLNYINDKITSSSYNADLINQSAGNYGYDAIGNMIKATSEKLTNIDWNVYGKILSITKATGNITYTYDPSGNRVSKTGPSGTTWYVRDAQGNTLAVYDNVGGTTNWKEQHLYGSSRVGVWTPTLNVSTGSTADPAGEFGIVGKRFYELSNHLGNVLATVSDKRIQTGAGTPVTYLPDVINAQDYYGFGMIQPTRQFTATNATKYRYGFNGKENDNDVKLDASNNEISGGQQDYGMRIYDPRLGRFLSVDPLYKSYPNLSSYQYASNSPISGIDLDGGEYLNANEARIHLNGTTISLTLKNMHDVTRSLWNMRDQAGHWPSGNIGYPTEIGKAVFPGVASAPEFQDGGGQFPSLNLDNTYGANNPAYNAYRMTLERDYPKATSTGLPDRRYKQQTIYAGGSATSVMASATLALNTIDWGLEQLANFQTADDRDKVYEQTVTLRTKVLVDLNAAVKMGLVPKKYLNARSLGDISNVILTGVNLTNDRSIYDVGIAIVKRVSHNFRAPSRKIDSPNGGGQDNTKVEKKINLLNKERYGNQ